MKRYLRFAAACVLSIVIVCAFKITPTSADVTQGKYVDNHTLGKHVLTIVDDSTDLRTKLTTDTSETYEKTSRKWNGITSVITAGNNVFVAWRTGGMREPSPFVYIVVAASSDGGKTFQDPFLILDPLAPSAYLEVPMFYYNHAGELYLTYRVFGPGSGEYAIKFVGPDRPLNEIRFEEPIVIGNPSADPGGCFVPFAKPLLLEEGRILFGSSNYAEKQSTAVMESVNDGKSFYTAATIPSEAGNFKTNGESSIVKLSDGTLWCLSRIEGGYQGGIEESYSYDGGKNWSVARGDLSAPLHGPGSRFTMINLADGGLLFVTNDSTSVRNHMTAYLSYDDGRTWPYSLVIDPHISAYPDAWQAPDGAIYVSYDKGRYTEGGVRLSVFTVEDLKAGAFISEKAIDKISVAKSDPAWADIVSVETKIKEMVVKVGTSIDRIISDLPKTLTVNDSNDKKHTLTGNWSGNNYHSAEEGICYIYFQTVLPDKLVDSFQLLRVKVVISGKKNNSALIYGLSAGGVVLLLGAGAILAARARKKRSVR